MDGSLPEHEVLPGESFIYEFDAEPAGLHRAVLDISALSETEQWNFDPARLRLMPDGDNGYLLVGNGTSSAVYRINPEGVLSPRVDLLGTGNVGSVHQADYVLGEDGGLAFSKGKDRTAGRHVWSSSTRRRCPC